MPSFLERKLAGALVPGGHRPALGLRCRWATSHRDVAAPKGGAKSRLPLWGRWTRVSEDGEGKAPAASSHGLCRSAGGLPSQSPNGDSSPKGGAKYVRYQKLAQSQVSPPPLGEVSCLWHDGEGNPPPARTCTGGSHRRERSSPPQGAN